MSRDALGFSVAVRADKATGERGHASALAEAGGAGVAEGRAPAALHLKCLDALAAGQAEHDLGDGPAIAI